MTSRPPLAAASFVVIVIDLAACGMRRAQAVREALLARSVGVRPR